MAPEAAGSECVGTLVSEATHICKVAKQRVHGVRHVALVLGQRTHSTSGEHCQQSASDL